LNFMYPTHQKQSTAQQSYLYKVFLYTSEYCAGGVVYNKLQIYCYSSVRVSLGLT
jgi:hypothetical protein